MTAGEILVEHAARSFRVYPRESRALKDLVLHAVGIEAGLPSILRAPAAGQETGPISSNV